MLTGSYAAFYDELRNVISESRLYTDPLRTLAYGTDASVYRLTPKIVVDTETEDEVIQLLRLARKHKVPVTFRAAGTSLSGQAVTDSVLVRLGQAWRKYRVGAEAASISLQPGIIGAHANAVLAEFGRKIGPDPASIDTCKIGGILANNASGMCCGTSDNSYKTLVSSRLIMADGTLLDTADAKSRAAFAKSHKRLLDGLSGMHQRITADKALADRIRRKFKIKNTTGYSINAVVDFEDPYEILQHLMVGSEGTLGFIAEVTYRTVEEHSHKASALLLFPTVHAACEATITLTKAPVAAVELMDRASLRSVEGQPGLPAGLETLGPDVCSLLVETRAADAATLAKQMAAITKALEKHPTVWPVKFTDVPEEFAALWLIRKGILPSVGAMREVGTSLLIEDVAFPLERLADAALDLQAIFARHGYTIAPLFGHARDGNLHFVITQDFGTPSEVARYAAFMDDLCRTITEKYDGSLKAEHGTGRNIAPFVEMEWGAQAFALMKEIKHLFDPEGLLNPGVILNDDPQSHIHNLKPMHEAHELIDKCTECGFCEPTCPSRGLSLTPRQRITVWREIQRLDSGPVKDSMLKQLEKTYEYMGKDTCAADGLCAMRCPAKINTGSFIKHLRHEHAGKLAKSTAGFIQRHFSGVCKGASLMLTGADTLHRVAGASFMRNGSRVLRALSFGKSPVWSRTLPKGGSPMPAVVTVPDNPRKVVYFPSCISRNMGPGAEHHDRRTEPQATVSLLLKAGYDVIFPAGLDALCCGMAFASKGFTEEAKTKEMELSMALLQASENGKYPILTETSPCLLHMKETLNTRLQLFEPVVFVLEHLAPLLSFKKLSKSVAVHATCSTRKMGLENKLADLARKCAEEVVVPEGVNCCGFAGDRGFTHPELNESALKDLRMQVSRCDVGYSTSRTCQIGLSLHGGIPYYSILFLVDEATAGK